MTKSVKVTIEGLSPLLMHAYPMVPIEAVEKKTVEEQAELAAYRDPDGSLCIPSTAIQRALVAGAAYSKGKGRASLQKPAAACLLVEELYLPLPKINDSRGTAPHGRDFAIDSRPVVIPATKGRVLRHRPIVHKWGTSFTLCYDDSLLSGKQVRQIVDDTGKNVGVLDFRPEKKGPFGRFIVTHWIDS